jgi:hypothetical protein
LNGPLHDYQDHERIRGGLYFIKNIPRDENWKVRRDVLSTYEPKSAEEVKIYEIFLIFATSKRS